VYHVSNDIVVVFSWWNVKYNR